MIGFVKEIYEPLKDFYKMRKKRKFELVVFIMVPIVIGMLLFLFEIKFDARRNIDIDQFMMDLLNQLVTVLTLFISFSMAYLSIIVTSGSDTINKMKARKSKYYLLDNEYCTLFQVLMSDLTYTLIVEIIFLLFIFFQKFLIYMCGLVGLRILISMDVCFLVHVLLMLMLTVKNIYFSFWKG